MSNKVEFFRNYYGLSQRQLAEKANISHAEMNFIEAEKRIPNVFIAQRIAKVLDISTDELFIEDERYL